MEVTDPVVELAGRCAYHLLGCHIVNLPSWVIKAVCHTELGQLRYHLFCKVCYLLISSSLLWGLPGSWREIILQTAAAKLSLAHLSELRIISQLYVNEISPWKERYLLAFSRRHFITRLPISIPHLIFLICFPTLWQSSASFIGH